MSIVDRIFRSGGTMPAVAEQSETELAARLTAVNQQIAGGHGDLVAAFEEKEQLEREIRAASIRRERAAEQASREARAAAVAELDRRADEIMMKFGVLLPQLLFAAQDFRKFVDEIMAGHPGSNGRQFPAILGVDHEFGTRIEAAILAENLELDFGVCLPGGKGSKPTLKGFRGTLSVAYKTDIHGRRIGSTTYI